MIVAEGAASASPPQQQLLLPAFAAQRRGGFDQQPKNDRAIIAGQLDQIGLSDESAKLDQ
jgi:hypothetical protein